jgi:hypothetical protein
LRAVLDQVQPLVTGGLSIRVGVAQTVTVGLGGLLVRVDLPFCSPIAQSVVALTVSRVGSERPTTTATVTFPQSSGVCAWYTFTFRQPLRVTVGEMVLLVPTVQSGEAPLWGWGSVPQGGDPYPRGTGIWQGMPINDFAFATYVQPPG